METEAIDSQLSLDGLTSAPGVAKKPWEMALDDIIMSLFSWRIWLLLGWQDIQVQYRRSSLGPFWITLSMAIRIYTMGFLYAHLFKMRLNSYFPFLAASMLTWSLISMMLIDLSDAFNKSFAFLKQMKISYTIFILRVVWRNFIVFLHNIIVIIPLIFIYHMKINVNSLWILPALVLLGINACCFGMLLSVIGSRYRDFSQMVKSLIQVAFFLTPVMWDPSTLPAKYQILVEVNPFAQFVELLREPLMGVAPSEYCVLFVLTVTLLGAAAAFYVFSKYRSRIIFWL